MRRVKLFLLILSLPILMFAQEMKKSGPEGKMGKLTGVPGVVKGKIVDAKSGEPIEFASIAIYNEKDSSLIGGVVSDQKGAFNLDNVNYGKFYLKLNFIGYKPLNLKDIIVNPRKPVYDLGVIKFNPDVATLNEVEVSAEKPLVEYSLDKKVVNVEKNLTVAGGTAVDVLNQIPSVTVDADGNVSLRGNTNVTVLLDGRQSSMTAARLQQIPASQVESVELITNPSAKYNPDGMAGIVNIKLKTQKEKGFNGMAMVNAGTGNKSNGDFDINKYNTSINLNWKYKKFNFFGSWDLRNNHMGGKGYSYRETNVKDTNSIITQSGKMSRQMNSNGIKGGFDFMPDKKNTFTLSAFYNKSLMQSDFNAQTFETINSRNLYNKTLSPENENSNSTDITANYKRTFDKKDKVLTADAVFAVDKEYEKEESDLFYYPSQTNYNIDSTYIERTITNAKNNSAIISLNFANPIDDHLKYETGFQSIIKGENDDFTWEEKEIKANEFEDEDGNTFEYNQQIHAVYGILSGDFEKYSFNAGLRVEQSYTSGELESKKDTNFTHNYFNLYPSAFFTYKISKEQNVQISYSRRVNRPNMHQLNPFRDISNPNYIRYGNPDLKPEYIDSYELSYLRYLMKTSTISADLFYKQINNVIKYYTTIANSRTTENTFINLSTGSSYGIELIADFQIIKGWRTSANYSYFKTDIKGNNQNTALSNSNYSWTGKFNSTITLPAKFNIQVNANYRGKMVSPQGYIKPMYNVDIAIKKDILKDNASINFRVSDIFNTQKFTVVTDQPGLYMENTRRRESRIAYLSFTYRLNYNPKSKPQKKEQQNGNGTDDMEGF